MKACGLLSAALALCLVQGVLCQSEGPNSEANVRPVQPQEGPQRPPQSPARQRPPAGIGGLLSGLLGTITKTADVSDCPGKCIHAFASLMCDTVMEEVQCPSASMRCCVERSAPTRKPLVNKSKTTTEATTTTKKRRRTTTPPRTTPRTTTKRPTTTKRTTPRVNPTTFSVDRSSAPGKDRVPIAHGPIFQRSNGGADKFDDKDADIDSRSSSSSSRRPPTVAPAAAGVSASFVSLSVLMTSLTLTLTSAGTSRTA